MFRPPYLQSGDKVALVSPAGIIDPLSIHDAVEVLRSWELNPIVGPNAAATYGYFAGRDEQRLQDMQWALDDEDIRAILYPWRIWQFTHCRTTGLFYFPRFPEMAYRIQRYYRFPFEAQHAGH